MKTAIVTGCPGQDASYLTELLLSKGYKVYGIYRRSSTEKNASNMVEAEKNSNFHQINLDITDASGIFSIISHIRPDEYYNLAAMSHVGQSFKEPISCAYVNGTAVTIVLEAIAKHSPHTRFYQASTSEMFGGVTENQSENTPFVPRSPYSAAKMYAHNMVDIYRKSYGIYACCGILFNHESPRRGFDFVTRKITNGIARYKLGLSGPIELGNLAAKRDWGHAKDYVKAMWMMLQAQTPSDYVVATGETISIKDALHYVCGLADINPEDACKINPSFNRPLEVNVLCGDPSKIKRELGWQPEYTWRDLLYEMYKHDYSINYAQSVLNNGGKEKAEETKVQA
jgi:GDPmannose 4,6-dehydratase